ncbi:MAG: PHP domain-containing protein [Acidimicrobiia bacterium]
MVIDLHTHSVASDGSDRPAQLAAMAAGAGLSAFALTDHDTVAGLAEAKAAAEAVGVRLVPGCELACEVQRGGMHLLVYFLEDGPGPLQDQLARMRAGRGVRNERILGVLARHGMPISVAEVMAEAGEGTVGRPHIAALMVRKGYVTSFEEAFDRWLASGRPAYLGRDRLTPTEAITLAHASGAVAVLAHPTTLGLDREAAAEFIAGLADAGLDGLECEYGRYPPEERAVWHSLAGELGLCPTGGSDYHGAYKPDLALGTGLGDLRVPDELLEELELRRQGLREGVAPG